MIAVEKSVIHQQAIIRLRLKKKPNKDNTKEKSKPKLYKVGKTPVNYK
jgi:hypothetical protein